jgi:transcriptional regulator with XRE-family HTH domain
LQFVGLQVRERRRFLGMTIADLSAACGISLSNLSKIETAQVSPSLQSLEAITMALGVSVSWLFQGYKDEGFLIQIPKGKGLVAERPGKSGGHVYELLSNNTGQVQALQPYLVTLDETGPQRASFTNRATEFVYVLEGQFTYRYGTRILSLSQDDALIFDGRTSHGPECILEGPVRYLAVLVRISDDTL